MAARKRKLTLADVFCIAAGAMISSGLFVLPGLAHAQAGAAVVASYCLAGLLAATGALSIAELCTAMPKAGGDYFFISRGMGPAIGTISGLLNWFALSLKSSFALVGMGALVEAALPVEGRIVGLGLCGLFVLVNGIGVKQAARVQVALVVVLLGLMASFVFCGLPAVKVHRLEPFAPGGLWAVFSTAGLVFISFGGLLKIASVSEEVSRPARTIPRGILLALLVVLLLYVLMVLIVSTVLDAESLHGSLTPIPDAASVFMGRPGRVALTLGAVLAFLTTANAGIMAASQYLLAMSRDRLLPSALSALNKRFHTPHWAVLLTGIVSAAALFIRLGALVRAASAVLMVSYVLSNLSVIILRESGLQNYRPRFRAPLYPWVQCAGIVGLAFVVVQMGLEAFFIASALMVVGFLIYWFYGRPRAERESALIHLIERITAKELVTGNLEAELKRVIRDRDEIVLDRFDRIIEDCVVIDVTHSLPIEELFRIASHKLSPRLRTSAQTLSEALSARENESSTLIAPYLAVPHVVVEGQGRFEVVLARSKKGFRFSPDKQAVHCVFLLIGTRDQRNFHLQALSAIAQVVQEPEFDEKWLRARGTQGLRDVVLLAERRRQ